MSSVPAENDLPISTFVSVGRDISLSRLVHEISKHWLVVVAGCGFGFLVALTYLTTTTPAYEVSAVVSPVGELTRENEAEGSIGGGLASLAGLNLRSSQVTRIDRFLLLLFSARVAEQLESNTHVMSVIFPKDWDDAQKRWVKPSPSFFQLGIWGIRRALGRPEWTAPTAYDFANYLQTKIQVALTSPERGLPIYRLTIDDPDPDFASKLLSEAIRESDNVVREIDAGASAQRILYIERQLGSVTSVEHRQALIALLADQERTLMLAAPNQTYAAELLEPVHASSRPIKPRVDIIVALGVFLGLVLGMFVVILKGSFSPDGG
jgi:hypothetical protein